MSQPQPLVDRKPAVRLLKGQVSVALVLPLLALVWGLQACYSVAIGAGIALAGSAYFAWQAFRHAGAVSAKQVVKSFYKGEAGKFGLTVLLFAVVFVSIKPLAIGWLLTGFFLVQLVALVSPLWDALHHKP